MMQPSIGSVTFADSDFGGMMRRSVRAGFKNLELVCIPGWIHANLDQTPPDEIFQAVHDAGMQLIALYPGVIHVIDGRPTFESIEYIMHACDAAQRMNVGRIVFTGCDRDTPLDATIAGLRQLAEHIAGTRTRICLENHYRHRIETPTDYRAILDAVDSPNIGITMDTGHFTASGIDMIAFIQEFSSKIYHVHLKDHIGARSVPIGAGDTPNAAVLHELREIGYDGYVSLELEVDDPENLDRYAAEAWNTMQRLLGDQQ